MEIIQYTIPALIVFITAFFMMWFFFRNDDKKRRHELIIENRKITAPIKLQAYERLVLFLERISPESMLVRVKRQGMTSQDLQKEVLRTIRSEYEHNLSQQIYIGHEAWEVLVAAKENTIKLVNTSMIQVPPNAPAMELSRVILESMMSSNVHSPKAAIEFIKKEVARLL